MAAFFRTSDRRRIVLCDRLSSPFVVVESIQTPRVRVSSTNFHSSSVQLTSRRRNNHALQGRQWDKNVFRDIFVKTNDTLANSVSMNIRLCKQTRSNRTIDEINTGVSCAADYFFTNEVSNFESFVYLKRKIEVLECYRMIPRQH